jgi:ABC-type sugar transport system permease subunit
MLMFIGALASLPQETVEAAQVDGARAFACSSRWSCRS